MAPTAQVTQSRSGTVRQAADVYDPNQNLHEKREVRAKYRELQAGLENKRQEGMANIDFEQLNEIVKDTNRLYEKVKAPAEGVLDSRLLMNVADMGHALAKSLRTETSGFDLDDYINKVALYINTGGARAMDASGRGKGRGSNGRQRRRATAAGSDVDDEDDSEDDEIEVADDWQWDKLGRTAARWSRRAPMMDFLNGPLKSEYNKRQVQRRQKIDRAAVVERPQELGEGDIEKSANETTKQVMTIHKLLRDQGADGVSMFDFAIDPKSFGNTVENLFYISFLIRDGKTQLVMPGEESNANGVVPKLRVREPAEEEDYVAGLRKQQIVLELDMDTWKGLIETHNLTRCIIPTRRNEPPRGNARGQWYG
ncbi:hypothetical protein K437DRAFT_255077 [Tilletiaria anomala UBC 951]|uniref:Non-structural maintenance of chromosomes element 4 n=1 Tax=Tilletiaria anomala (strain ATCC 24038 / CBS 436.72 / UBC 951) TaxID=1037660 RepID=A0A066WCY8_TILAU|nr:uncharacterized protein K437DRAFT_255077 [Tilletiaria anomala UBC 951]KDN50373.1 hypothetical protein K437DRAFT_255077 [Tilletiaria anomala UBC 951]